MVPTKLHYDHNPSKRYCESIGMAWDHNFAERFDLMAERMGLTQGQFDELVREHAWRIKHLFTPATYPWSVRFRFAIYFLNPFSKQEDHQPCA